jgi:hypothetical protein
MPDRNEMITDKIKSVVSLLKTKNIIVIKTLVDVSYITREILIQSLDLYLDDVRQDHIRIFLNEIVEVIINDFGDFDNVNDKNIINKLFAWFLADDSLYYDESSHNNCFIKLIDCGATIDTLKCPRIVMLPTYVFWYYVSKHDLLITQHLMSTVVSTCRNHEIQDYIFNCWYSQESTKDWESLVQIIISAMYHKDQKYVADVMQIIYPHIEYDKIIVRTMTLLYSPSFALDFMKYVTKHTYYDELSLLCLIIIKSHLSSHHHDFKKDTEMLDMLVEQNIEARKIFDLILPFNYQDSCDFYNNGYNEIIKNLTRLNNLYVC